MTTLVSSAPITVDPAAAIYERHKVQGTYGLIKHDVEVHRIVYTTKDPTNRDLKVSGALLVPKGVKEPRTMCYCRGTIIPGSYEHAAPSYYKREAIKDPYDDHYEMSFMAATFAAAGYLVVVPDCIGYGESKGASHPYMHARTLASTSLDMLRAARELASQRKWAFSPRVYIAGWSEGGLCGMALHKLIEESCKGEFDVAASSLLAGTYALSAQIHLFCSYDEDYPEAQTNYWKLRTMCEVYKLDRPFDRIVARPYAGRLAEDVMALAPKNPRHGLDPGFREGFLAGTESEMEAALRDNDRYDWGPNAPIYLHHGTHDDIVPFFCAQMAYEAMKARRCRVKLYPYLGRDHYQPAPAYTIQTIRDF